MLASVLRRAAFGALLASSASTAASIQVLTSTASGAFAFTVGSDDGAHYYSPAAPVVAGCGNLTRDSTQVLPLTVLKTNQTAITADVLSSLVSSYAASDDVFTEEFLGGGAIIISDSPGAVLDGSASAWIHDAGFEYLLPSEDLDFSSYSSSSVISVPSAWNLAPGPYTLSIGPSGISIREVYRLYRDNYEAFLMGTTRVLESGAHVPVDVFIPSSQDVWVPVPSRLYSLEDDRPLAGLRIALKDIYDLDGVTTSGGSRSYAEVMPTPNTTASSVRRLLDLGAVVVGKTKTSQFAHGADPWQFLDHHYPWNPRGDGYLTAASSSSGSAVAIAGYDWVDVALGTDTRGSVRKPAALVGSYGIRPTWGSKDLDGIIALANEMDTAGFFARDPALFLKFWGLWYEDAPTPVNTSFTGFPSRVIYPVDYFPVANPAAQEIFDDFLAVLEEEFGTVRTELNFTETLATYAGNPTLTNLTAFQLNSNRLAEYVSYHTVGKPLAEAWAATFPEKGYPPLDPNPRAAFERSVNLTAEDYDEAVAIKNEFRDFFLEHVVRPDEASCSDIMVLDMGTGGLPSYRESALNSRPGAVALSYTAPGGQATIPSNYLASTAGCPQVGIPMGQVSYQSYISLQEEKIPVNVDLVAAPGCDAMLLEIVKRLSERGVAKTVKTGRTPF